MRLIIWAGVNGLMAWGLYLAGFKSSAGAENVISFVIVLNFVITLLVSLFDEAKKKAREKGPPVDINISITYGVIYAVTLAYLGWFWLAGVSIFESLTSYGIYSEKDQSK